MILFIQINNQTYEIDTANPLDISIPLNFNGEQPNAYGVEKASSQPCKAGDIIGDTRRGGSVNFEQIKFIPHCNGTHTECVGHITHERISVQDCLKDAFIPAALISVKPEKASETDETYPVKLNPDDKLITRKAIEESRVKSRESRVKSRESNSEIPNPQSPIPNPQSPIPYPLSFIIRTLPNDERKLSKTYLEEIPPFFSTEAMELMREIGITHLLVDLPSIDRIFDEGKLSNHRIFWNVEPGSFEINAESLVNKTVTELIYVPDEIKDGSYLLNLQIASFVADASPSRPILFNLTPVLDKDK